MDHTSAVSTRHPLFRPNSRRSRSAVAQAVAALVIAAAIALVAPDASAEVGDPIPGGGRAQAVGIGDFDGNGTQEAALIIPGRSTVVTIDLSTLDNQTREVRPGGGPIGDAEPVGVADIDGDGRDDLVVTTSENVDVWYRGLRNGTFSRGAVLGTGDNGNSLKTVGALDGFDAPGTLASLAPAGIFGQPLRYRGLVGELASTSTDTGFARFMVAGRFEPDDREQLRLFVDRTGSRTSLVSFRLEGATIRGFVLSEISWTLTQTRNVIPGDVDGDGLDDWIVQRTDGSVWVFANDGAGDIGPIRQVATADELLTESAALVGAADINGDGLDDLVVLDGATPFRLWGSVEDLFVPERPASERRCAGREITVEIGFGEVATEGDDVIVGTPGDDQIDGLGGDDVICALGGDDVVRAGTGADRVLAGPGADVVAGGPGRDVIIGGSGDDELRGQGGPDRLRGGRGDDRLLGQRGPDRLVGAAGDNTCIGGPGRDRLGRGC